MQTYSEALLERWHELWDLASEARDAGETVTARHLFAEADKVHLEYQVAGA